MSTDELDKLCAALNEARRVRNEARAELAKAVDALGERDDRWWKGESPIDALIRWRDDLHVELSECRRDIRREKREGEALVLALMKAERERDELRSAMERDALPGTVLSDVCRERDAARAELEIMRAKKNRLMEERGKAEAERDKAISDAAQALAERIEWWKKGRREGAEAMRAEALECCYQHYSIDGTAQKIEAEIHALPVDEAAGVRG